MALFHGPAFSCRVASHLPIFAFVSPLIQLQLQTPFLMNQLILALRSIVKGRPLTKRDFRFSFFSCKSWLAQQVDTSLWGACSRWLNWLVFLRPLERMASLIVLAHSSQPKCQQPTSCWLTRTCPLKDTEKEKNTKDKVAYLSLSLSLGEWDDDSLEVRSLNGADLDWTYFAQQNVDSNTRDWDSAN